MDIDMTDLWQNVMTGAIVAAATGYLICRIARFWNGKRGAGCHACSHCPSQDDAALGTKKPLVTLDGVTASDRRES